MSKRRFFVTLGIYIVLVFLWYGFIYVPQTERLNQINIELNNIAQKVMMARNAQINLDMMKKRFEEEQKRLEQEQSKFIKRDELGKVTKALSQLANRYNLKLVDFSPGLKNYFEVKEGRIVPLPLSITLIGRYVQIGKFIEEWNSLPFYLIPQELTLERLDKNGYDLQAVIETKLYTWNE